MLSNTEARIPWPWWAGVPASWPGGPGQCWPLPMHADRSELNSSVSARVLLNVSSRPAFSPVLFAPFARHRHNNKNGDENQLFISTAAKELFR